MTDLPAPPDVNGSDDLKRFAEALGQSTEFSIPMAEKAIGIGLSAIREVMAPYPPQPARDRAKTFNTYVRGIGRFPKSSFEFEAGEGLWLRKAKSAYLRGPRGGKVRRTSQRLSTKWRLMVWRMDGAGGQFGVEGELRNDATYSGWVNGPIDKAADPHQVAPHTLTGWVNADDGLAQAQPEIDAAFAQALDGIVKALVSA
jgi:hypothetical protein